MKNTFHASKATKTLLIETLSDKHDLLPDLLVSVKCPKVDYILLQHFLHFVNDSKDVLLSLFCDVHHKP